MAEFILNLCWLLVFVTLAIKVWKEWGKVEKGVLIFAIILRAILFADAIYQMVV